MYSIEERNNVQNSIIALAKNDVRITDCAIVGSESVQKQDVWSDIDLSFGFKNGSDISKILEDWNKVMGNEFNAHVLFDLNYRESIYRVYLLPNALQVDLSFTNTDKFGAITDKFKLLFGKSNEREQKQPPDQKTVFGYGVLYALKARCSIEREKFWQARYFLEKLRENLMILKCTIEQLNPFDGRGYDELPKKFLDRISKSFQASLKSSELKQSLQLLTGLLINEVKTLDNIGYKFERELEIISESRSL